MIGVILIGFCIAGTVPQIGKGPFHAQIKSNKTKEFGIDSATLQINETNPSRPISWNVKLYRDGKTIFDTSATDDNIDQYFKDTVYVTGCTGYESCKSKWYFNEFETYIIRNDYNKVISDPRISADAINKSALQYQGLGLTKKEATTRAKEIIDLIKQRKVDLFMPSWAPEGRNVFPKVYDAKFRHFIEVNEW